MIFHDFSMTKQMKIMTYWVLAQHIFPNTTRVGSTRESQSVASLIGEVRDRAPTANASWPPDNGRQHDSRVWHMVGVVVQHQRHQLMSQSIQRARTSKCQHRWISTNPIRFANAMLAYLKSCRTTLAERKMHIFCETKIKSMTLCLFSMTFQDLWSPWPNETDGNTVCSTFMILIFHRAIRAVKLMH